MILNEFNYVDLIIGLVVGLLLIGIIIYLVIVYKNNPCGDCQHSKQCKALKKMSKSLLKNYKKCNNNDTKD